MKGKRHGIELGSMAHIKQEVAQPIIHKVKHKATALAKHPSDHLNVVGSMGKSHLDLSVAKKPSKVIIKAGKHSAKPLKKAGSKLKRLAKSKPAKKAAKKLLKY